MAEPYQLPGLSRGRLAAAGGKLSVHHPSNALMAPVSLWLLCVKINCSKVPYEDFSILVCSLTFLLFSWSLSLTVFIKHTKFEDERNTYDRTSIGVCTVMEVLHQERNADRCCAKQLFYANIVHGCTNVRCLNVWEEDIESPYTEADRSGLKRCEQLGQCTQMHYRWNCPETKTALS